jgi:periplasmic divalent cation tolerance protein
MTDQLVILITTPDHELADRIAVSLVEEKLAACVNIVPQIRSVYRWQGEVTRDSESLMIVKTTARRYPDLEKRVKELHSYSTPEVIALRIDRGSADYLEWIIDSTD